ncbi:ATP-binding protein [Candidatus Nitrosotenuis aquarius]|uniref:ATP-binding protein n=1 Tax=Candidatus Nitrosotenuis aquarius TaxID=1846278 RepID=UPI000C1E7E7F|nr:ATP-binding protein [Candidatus Nitrosotenuis aquarius]
MVNWYCICGNFVRDKRFCPRCKFFRFRIENSPILDYWGLRVGTLSNGLPFNFPVNFLATHVLVSGQTGTGKTRFAMNLAVKSSNYESFQKIKLLVVDVEGEWKNIIPKLKGQTEYFAVDKNLKINPFDLGDPALIRELMRETVFKGIEKEYVDLSAQMNFVLQETISESHSIDELIKNIKYYDRQKLTALDKTKTALLVRLDPFMRSPLKEIFLCNKSNPDFSRLDEKNVIIDLHALDALVAYGAEIRLIYNTITTYYLRKMLNRGPCDWVSNLFIADEAQLLVPKILHKIVVTESWPATEFATRLRKRGCGLMLITQSPSNIEKDIFKNVGTKIAFRLQHQEDIRLLSEAAAFVDQVEYEYLADRFVRLPRTTAIAIVSGYEPFLVTADSFDIMPHEVAADAAVMEAAAATATTETANKAKAAKDREDDKDNGDDEDNKTFLESIDKEPFLSVIERRTKLGWDDKRYTNVTDELCRKKKIELVRVKLGRGAPRILYQRPGTVPGVKHEFYVNWIAESLTAKGYDIRKNKDGPDIEVLDRSTVIEVELGTSNISGNLKRNLQEFDRVIVCSDDSKLIEALSAKSKENRILFLPVQKVPAVFEKMRIGKDFLNT